MNYIQNLKKRLGNFDEWRYAGGNQGSHKLYFYLMFGEKRKPPAVETHCQCNHFIKEQCYIYNSGTDQLVVLGNCCIKKFIPKHMRTCEDCDKPHRNRKWNKCNECVKKICFNCGKQNSPKYRFCYKCYKNK